MTAITRKELKHRLSTEEQRLYRFAAQDAWHMGGGDYDEERNLHYVKLLQNDVIEHCETTKISEKEALKMRYLARDIHLAWAHYRSRKQNFVVGAPKTAAVPAPKTKPSREITICDVAIGVENAKGAASREEALRRNGRGTRRFGFAKKRGGVA